MADNYLENQYEQYQARKAAWEKAGRKPVSSSPKINQERKANASLSQEEDDLINGQNATIDEGMTKKMNYTE